MRITKKHLYWLVMIGYFLSIFSLKAQGVGLVLPFEDGWILNKLDKGEALNINGLEIALWAVLDNDYGEVTTFRYRGFFVDNKEGILAMKLLKPPRVMSNNRKRWGDNTSFKKEVLVEYHLALTDIYDIHLIESKDKPLAVIGDVVGFLGGVTFGASLFAGIVLENSRPDLSGKKLIGYSILGLGLSYLATRIGHLKKYKNKSRRKRKYNHWVIIK